MEVTFFYGDEQALAKGTGVELLGDGQVLATETIGDGGVVSFDAETSGVTKLAVRLLSAQTTSNGNKKQ
jgi:hypothetical protein